MQLLIDSSFVHYDTINFTNNLFAELFGQDVKLLSFNTSTGGMGYFVLNYLYVPQHYTIVFEHDRLFFSVRIYKANGAFTSLNQAYDGEMNNVLNEENISIALSILSDVLKTTVPSFYHLKKNHLVKEEG